jgi:putative sterol carrier protein
MGVQFLSEEWTKAVQDALNDNAAFKGAVGSLNAKIQQVVTTDGGDEKRYWFTIADGQVALGPGDLEGGADATITQDYATAVALSKNELTGVAAYMSGKIKIAGDMMKLMQLQGPMAQMPAALSSVDVDY